jgi:hypothetical protein
MHVWEKLFVILIVPQIFSFGTVIENVINAGKGMRVHYCIPVQLSVVVHPVWQDKCICLGNDEC